MEGEKGRPKLFKTEKDFEDRVIEYIEYCEINERFVNIAGLCRHLGIHRQRFYDQKTYYPDTFLRIQEILEDETLNNTTQAVPITLLYLKNKFGYRDKIETENTNTNTNKNMNLDNLTDEQIDRILASE